MDIKMDNKKEKIIYIVLLRSRYVLFFKNKPPKKDAYLIGVKLFQTVKSTSALEISIWLHNKFKHPQIKEVKDWV